MSNEIIAQVVTIAGNIIQMMFPAIIEGSVVTKANDPIYDAVVTIGDNSVTTCRDGSFHIKIKRGTYEVGVMIDNIKYDRIKSIHVNGGDNLSIKITIPDFILNSKKLNPNDNDYTNQNKKETTDIIAHWSFKGNAKDTSENNNHGTLHGNVTLTADRNGQPNSAYQFNGIDSYISVPDSPSLNPANQLTMSFWVKVDGFPGRYEWSSIIYKGNETGGCARRDYSIWVNKSSFFHVSTGNGRDAHGFNTNGVSVQDKWFFVVCVIDRYVSHKMKLFVDGVLNVESDDSYSFFYRSSQELKFGTTSEFRHFFKGALSDVRFYNRALNEDEIKHLQTIK